MTWARTHWIAIATAAVLFFVGIGIGASGGESKSATKTTTVTKTHLEIVRAKLKLAKPGPAASFGGDGTWLVGKDMRPGIYRARATSSGNCYWARLHDLDDTDNSIITNDNTSGPALLHVARSDYAVKTSGCETFHKVG